jgi:hypothetical protein
VRAVLRQGREEIEEDDLFTALEKIQQERLGGGMNSSNSSDETVRISRNRCKAVSCEAMQAKYLSVRCQVAGVASG